MRVLMLRNVGEERNLSMKLYADRLAQGLGGRCVVRSVVPWRPPGLASGHRLGAKALDYVARYGVYPASLFGRRGDVFHVVDHADAHLICSLPARRTVVTCHDMMLVKSARGDMKGPQARPLLATRLLDLSLRFMRRAARVIATSEATAADIVRHLKLPRERIQVIHHGVDPAYRPAPSAHVRQTLRRHLGFAGRAVVLHVGNNWFYKNLEGVIRALAVLRAERGDVLLVKVGKRLTREQRELADELGVADCVRELGVLSSGELLTVYWASDLLLFPSWWEGCGWPPLEAMASGTPVVCSDRGALGEVARGAALIVNPEEPEAIADGVARVLGDEGLRQSLVESGLERAGQFTWERAAAETLRVYREVAG